MATNNQINNSNATPLQVQRSSFNTASDTGAVNAYVVNLSPAVTSLTNGLIISTVIANTNTSTTTTLQINALSAVPITAYAGQTIAVGDMVAGQEHIFIYNATAARFQLLNPRISIANAYSVQSNAFNYAVDSGAANAYVGTLSPVPLSVLSGGMSARLLITNTNTGASTLNLNGSGVTAIVNGDNSALTAGQIVAGMVAEFVYSPTYAKWVLMNPYNYGKGGLKSFQIFTSGTAQTYTRPAGIGSILVEVCGGGGAGGGASSAASSLAFGGGGGGGGYARLYIANAAASYTYTVGAGGTAGTAGNNPGNAGGTTSFGASLQATGGGGGQGAAATNVTGGTQAAGGAGGIGSNGDLNVKGSNGTWGFTLIGVINPSVGGDSFFGGGGGNTTGTEGNGTAGGAYGGGGSGANGGTGSNRAGGAGAGGVIIVWEFA